MSLILFMALFGDDYTPRGLWMVRTGRRLADGNPWCPNFNLFSVQSLCSLCPCGVLFGSDNHRDTENTETAQRKPNCGTTDGSAGL